MGLAQVAPKGRGGSQAGSAMSSRDRIFVTCMAAALLFAIGIFLLLGLPGAVIMEVMESLAPSRISAFKGDRAWPAAIFISMAMPIGVTLSAVALSRMKPDTGLAASIFWGFIGYFLAGVLAAAALIAIG